MACLACMLATNSSTTSVRAGQNQCNSLEHCAHSFRERSRACGNGASLALAVTAPGHLFPLDHPTKNEKKTRAPGRQSLQLVCPGAAARAYHLGARLGVDVAPLRKVHEVQRLDQPIGWGSVHDRRGHHLQHQWTWAQRVQDQKERQIGQPVKPARWQSNLLCNRERKGARFPATVQLIATTGATSLAWQAWRELLLGCGSEGPACSSWSWGVKQWSCLWSFISGSVLQSRWPM